MFEFQEKSKIMLRFTYLVEKHSEELAALDTCGNGNTYDQAKTAEIAMIAGLFCNDAGIYIKILRILSNFLAFVGKFFFDV